MLTASSLVDLNSLFTARCVPLLFAAENRSPQALGSAVLLEKSGEHYLVSAAHNYKLVQEFGDPYLVVRRRCDPEYSSIARIGGFSCVISDDKGREQVDLLFSHFLKEESDRFPTFSAFVTEADFGDAQDAEIFFVVGFAASRNKRPKRVLAGQTIKKHSSASLQCDRHPNERKVLDELNYNHENHVVVSYNRRSCSRNGMKIFAPDPHGISGGALFGIKKDGDEYRGFLCGIATEYIERKGAIVCTRLEVLLEGIYPYRYVDDPGETANLRKFKHSRVEDLKEGSHKSATGKAAILLLPNGVGIFIERFDLTLGQLIGLAKEALEEPNITPAGFGPSKYFFFVNTTSNSMIDDTPTLDRPLSTLGIQAGDVIDLRLCKPAPGPDGRVLNPMRGVQFFTR